MKTYFSFHKEHFNNNGDQGNIEVLRLFLEKQGETLVESENLDADFVLFGDASRAALEHYETELSSLVDGLQQRMTDGKPTLLVGSSYEYFWPLLSGVPFQQAERSSEFRAVSSELGPIQGYRNSTIVDSDLALDRGFIGTTLFGPILAINPQLLNLVLEELNLVAADWSERDAALVQKVRNDFIDG